MFNIPRLPNDSTHQKNFSFKWKQNWYMTANLFSWSIQPEWTNQQHQDLARHVQMSTAAAAAAAAAQPSSDGFSWMGSSIHLTTINGERALARDIARPLADQPQLVFMVHISSYGHFLDRKGWDGSLLVSSWYPCTTGQGANQAIPTPGPRDGSIGDQIIHRQRNQALILGPQPHSLTAFHPRNARTKQPLELHLPA